MMSPGQTTAPSTLILHADDVGMCQGANLAFVELSRLGTIDSGSVMVPCPWFSEIAELARADATLDLGVHLTLNAEKRHYRWRPLTQQNAKSGLTDADGYFWRSVPELRRNARPEAVAIELRAQIDAAYAAGLDVTHLDGHMGAVLAPEYVDIFLQLGVDYDLPILFPRSIAAYAPRDNLGPVDETLYPERSARLAAAGLPVAERVLETPWRREAQAQARYQALLGEPSAGLTVAALHPNAPGEITAIEPDSAQIRIDEWALFKDEAFKSWLDRLPVKRTTMRHLRDQMRASRDAGKAPSRSP